MTFLKLFPDLLEHLIDGVIPLISLFFIFAEVPQYIYNVFLPTKTSYLFQVRAQIFFQKTTPGKTRGGGAKRGGRGKGRGTPSPRPRSRRAKEDAVEATPEASSDGHFMDGFQVVDEVDDEQRVRVIFSNSQISNEQFNFTHLLTNMLKCEKLC